MLELGSAAGSPDSAPVPAPAILADEPSHCAARAFIKRAASVYPKYFGLKEPSFAIAPDPRYLFLSNQHREALAQLRYGVRASGGLVLLTGEVGTGKTMVCRAFLEQLPEQVDVALILNPVQSPIELLINICEEFGITLPADKLSNKQLLDALNAYLLHAAEHGRQSLLMIDEAQNLSRQALESVRLLTNLETNQHKLLHIFLIGQPELRQRLETHALRQLDQRITARFHLTPLNLEETGQYIRHRLAVAGVDRPLFTARALQRIHTYSGGVPRVINILCDRALLNACITRRPQVDPLIVATAAREVRGIPTQRRSLRTVPRLALTAFLVATLVGWEIQSRLTPEQRVEIRAWIAEITGIMGAPAPEQRVEIEPIIEPPAVTPAIDAEIGTDSDMPDAALASESEAVAPESLATPVPPLAALALPETEALRLLLRRWGLEVKRLTTDDPCAQLRPFGLACATEQGQLQQVRFFNLPALLRVADHEGSARYVVLGVLSATEAGIDAPDGATVRIPLSTLAADWTGEYQLLWLLPPDGSTLIQPGAVGDAVRWLREQVAQVPGLTLAPSTTDRFDASLEQAVRAFQRSAGIRADGLVGPRTLIALMQVSGAEELPRLDPDYRLQRFREESLP